MNLSTFCLASDAFEEEVLASSMSLAEESAREDDELRGFSNASDARSGLSSLSWSFLK